jgi:hypothetical protein
MGHDTNAFLNMLSEDEFTEYISHSPSEITETGRKSIDVQMTAEDQKLQEGEASL